MKYILYPVLAGIAITLIVGKTSLFFYETTGTISKSSIAKISAPSYESRYGPGYSGGEKTLLNVRYEYFVDGKKIKGLRIAFWFTSSPKENYWPGKEISVFYFPLYPKLAVLKKGPDILLLVAVIFAILGWLFIRSLLKERGIDV